MEENSKRKKLVLGIIFICIILIAIIMFFMLNNKDNKALFRSSCINYAWGYYDNGYVIYNNGIIEEYDNADKERKLKKAKLTKEELEELKKLAVLVKDEYEENTDFKIYDAGICKDEIYNEKIGKWILLSSFGDYNGKNHSEESEKILELVGELYSKYILEE